MGAQTRGTARDLVLPRGYCGQGVAVDAVIAGNSELVFGLSRRRRRRATGWQAAGVKVEGKGSGGEAK